MFRSMTISMQSFLTTWLMHEDPSEAATLGRNGDGDQGSLITELTHCCS